MGQKKWTEDCSSDVPKAIDKIVRNIREIKLREGVETNEWTREGSGLIARFVVDNFKGYEYPTILDLVYRRFMRRTAFKELGNDVNLCIRRAWKKIWQERNLQAVEVANESCGAESGVETRELETATVETEAEEVGV